MRGVMLTWLCLCTAGCVGAAIGASPDGGGSIDGGGVKTSDLDKTYAEHCCSAGMSFVPAGNAFFPDNPPVEWFCIDTLETTVAEYRECVKARRCTLPKRSNRIDPSDPGKSPEWEPCNYYQKGRDRDAIDCLSFWQARDYCEFRHKRLPEVNEWMLAAGFGAHPRQLFPWGNELLGTLDVCWSRTPQQRTCKVGTHPKDVSLYGVLDMAGNAREWAKDRESDCPTGSYCSEHIKGDGWDRSLDKNLKYFPTNSSRWRVDINKGSYWAGVRCVNR
jgi:formylglycine-generating enzyme required for sulfatase activity